VNEIRKGSIIMQLVPVIMPLIQTMESVLIVDGFVRHYGAALSIYLGGHVKTDATSSELKDFLGTVAIVANDPHGSSTIVSATYHKTKSTTHAEFQFDTQQAKVARDLIERQRIEIELPAFEERANVLLRFYQSNVGDTRVGSKKTGEKAVIEAVSPKPLAVVYETELAKEQIKHVTRADEKNLYKKGFFVDCYVERSRGRPVAYRIVAVREIIDLPDD